MKKQCPPSKLMIGVSDCYVDSDDPKVSTGYVIAEFDCSRWSAEQMRRFWEFMHSEQILCES